ncbi:hypothetical protein F511_40924 [Dorcoceras hygrometricum]|uniref:Splicing factor 3B subunit 1-like n=1 Tax=Dorcoceras hygrometricum TaxID=472368 RepID=A0A2Z7A013_9LAMI|nr:hypothetical protein F511_40924 [Dorcoceras hygrometricum]
MIASLIQNDIQVYLDSVLSMEDEGMVALFRALDSSGLRGFLGCSSAIYEADLVSFYQNALVKDNTVISSVQGKYVEFSEEQFAGSFELPNEGLTSMEEVTEVPQVEKVAKKAAAKRRSALTAEPVAKRKRKTVGRDAFPENKLALVPVVQDVEPISERGEEEQVKERTTVEKPAVEEETVEEIVAKVIAETSEIDMEEIETGEVVVKEKEQEQIVGEEVAGTETVEMESRIDVSAITNDDDVLSSNVLSNEEGSVVETENEKDKETESVATDKGKSVEKIIDSEDTDPLSKVLELTETSTSDEDSMSIDDILRQIPEEMMLPSVTAEEPTKENFNTLNAHLSEIIAYINRGGDAKKGEESSRGPQPPEDRRRPGDGGSRSEPPRKRGSGSNKGGGSSRPRGFRYWFN